MHLYRFFKTGFLITFLLEVFCLFSIAIYAVFFGIFGGINLFGTEMNIILVLIALGCSCLLTLVGIGFFMRGKNKFNKFIGSESDFPTGTLAEKIVLAIWIAAIIFFSAAVFYGIYLIYLYNVFNIYGQTIGIMIIFMLLGIIIVCSILQLFLIITAKLTKRVVSEVLQD